MAKKDPIILSEQEIRDKIKGYWKAVIINASDEKDLYALNRAYFALKALYAKLPPVPDIVVDYPQDDGTFDLVEPDIPVID